MFVVVVVVIVSCIGQLKNQFYFLARSFKNSRKRKEA